MNLFVQRLLIATVLLFATAFWTPWWGTILVSIAMALIFQFGTLLIMTSSFLGWFLAAVLRDSLNDNGPSRTLVRLFSLSELGNVSSLVSVAVAISIVGALLGASSAGVINSAKAWRKSEK